MSKSCWRFLAASRCSSEREACVPLSSNPEDGVTRVRGRGYVAQARGYVTRVASRAARGVAELRSPTCTRASVVQRAHEYLEANHPKYAEQEAEKRRDVGKLRECRKQRRDEHGHACQGGVAGVTGVAAACGVLRSAGMRMNRLRIGRAQHRVGALTWEALEVQWMQRVQRGQRVKRVQRVHPAGV